MKTTDDGTLRRLWGMPLVAAFVLALMLSPLGQRAELGWLDAQFQWWRAKGAAVPDDSVAIVGIDDRDLAEFGVPVALLHRQVGEFLEAMAVAQPRAVGVDVLLPSTSFDAISPGLDAAVAKGLFLAKRAAPVVLGVSVGGDGAVRPLHPAFMRFSGAEGQGLVLVQNDIDGVVRRFDERYGDRGESAPSLAGQVARRLGVRPVPGVIDFLGGEPLGYTPLREVVALKRSGDAPALQRLFGGKIVLLGSVLALDDLHRAPVPLGAWLDDSRSHGVLIHAQQLRALLSSSMLSTLPAGAAVALVILLSATWFLRPSRGAWILAAVAAVAILAAGLFLLRTGWVIPSLGLALACLLGLGGRTSLVAWDSYQERRRLRATFDGFVSPAVLDEILSGRLRPSLGGERREVCVLFSDIRGFTTLSEGLPPETVTALLNRYFELMTAAIHRHGGTLDKFIGDGIMAFFGAPKALDHPCDDALRTAQDMIAALEAFNEEQAREGRAPIAIGVGLHYGPAIVGYIGSLERHEYSAIGDTVNVASRIEGLTKEAGFPVLLSEAVRDCLAESGEFIQLGPMAVKGHTAIPLLGWRPA